MKHRYFRGPLACLLFALLLAVASIAPAAAQAPPPPTPTDAPQPQPQPTPAKVALPSEVAEGVARLTSAITLAQANVKAP